MEPSQGLLTPRHGGQSVRIDPKSMELLILFATSDGRVIAKDEIVASVWGGRAIGDDTLAAAISRLRSALGATNGRRYIETLPKRGYRLAIAPNDGLAADPAQASPPSDDRPGREATEAEQLADRGLASLRTGAPAALPQARLYFEAAIRADATLASAQAGLAETLFAEHLMDQNGGATLLPLARAAAGAAVGLDEGSVRGWTALGYAALIVDRDFAAADRAFLRAISLDPAAASPHRYRAIALASVGRLVEAERESRKAVALEPLSLNGRNGLLQILLAGRRYRQTVAEAKAMAALSAGASEAFYASGWALIFLDRQDEGVEALLRGLTLWGVAAGDIDALRTIHGVQGFPALCAAVADFLEAQKMMFTARPTDIAALRAAAGQSDPAFAALEAAVARNDPYLLLLDVLPWFDVLNNDPRWRALVEKARPVR